MKNYIYDGSLQGLFTVIYNLFLEKEKSPNIVSEMKNSSLLFESIYVFTDMERAARVVDKIKKNFSKKSLYYISGAFLSEESGVENKIYNYIECGLKYGKELDNKMDNDTVLFIRKSAERCYKEAHKIKGLLRFKELADSTFYAPIFPECNIVPLIFKHFEKRFSSQNWVIHDIKRKTCVIYDGVKSEFYDNVTAEKSVIENHSSVLSSEELLFQALWKNYFQTIAIKERENLKLQMKFVPKKYWKYITEMESKNE